MEVRGRRRKGRRSENQKVRRTSGISELKCLFIPIKRGNDLKLKGRAKESRKEDLG